MANFLSELFDNLETDHNKSVQKDFSGEETREFYIDENGEAKETVRESGFGRTVEFTATIVEPDGNFEISVQTDGEGGLKPIDVSTGQAVNFRIEMRSWPRKTEVNVSLKSSLRNTTGKVRIAYRVV